MTTILILLATVTWVTICLVVVALARTAGRADTECEPARERRAETEPAKRPSSRNPA
jgi:hypothetical protein